MSIYHHTFIDIESVAENDIRRLATHTGKSDQLGHRLRHFAVVVFDQCAAGILDTLGLIAEEADAPDVILQLFQWYRGEIGGLSMFLE